MLPLAPPAGTPLYVHLPFCVHKCSYCDFFSVVADPTRPSELEATLDAVLAEARLRAPRAPRTVFFGGGTPSYFATGALVRFLDELDLLTGFRASASEVTLEANPESLTLEKARALRAAGVDRLSIGLQSLRPEILALFERPHDAEQGLRAYELARAAGFARVSVDLIYAVPGQELDGWERDLERVLALAPDHVSAYSLAFEEGTPFLRWLEDGRLSRPPEELERRFFAATRARLAAAGLSPYEVSNFAREGQQCAHNVNYWRNGAYVGLGPSAASKLGRTRFGSARSLGAWRAAVAAGGTGGWRPAWEETLAPRAALGETWWLGLRLAEGLDPAEARARAGFRAPADPTAEVCDELLARGLLERVGAAHVLSSEGLFVADAVASRFLSACGPDTSSG